MRILLCLKFREGYWGQVGSDLSSGLKNSVSFIVEMLNRMGHTALVVQLQDNNKIDAAIYKFRPDLVVLEAFWVVPSKLDVLIPKWPKVRWAVRNHSDIPFIANEGIAMDWLQGYWSRGVNLMSNDPVAVRDLQTVAWAYGRQDYYDLNCYAPNCYPLGDFVEPEYERKLGLDIGCFGAIRPLKNQLIQAVAAIQYCQERGRQLRFHINGTRVEQNGNPILNNLRALFKHTNGAELIEHPWLDHDGFVALMGTMDFALCVSFSETFCIVAADAVSVGVPVIGSSQIPWLGDYAVADETDMVSICLQLNRASKFRPSWIRQQYRDLQRYNAETYRVWDRLLRDY